MKSFTCVQARISVEENDHVRRIFSAELRSGRFGRRSDLWFRLEGQLEVHMNAIRILQPC